MTDRELTLERVIDAAPEILYRCWTEPDLLTQWFCPRPWTTPVIQLDVRPGGGNFILMRGPAGEEHPNHGVYLDVVPNRKLVMTDAFTAGWVPSDKAFMVSTITFDPIGPSQTLYRAKVQHWTSDDRAAHEAMGFHEGWGKATDQLESLARTL